MLKTILIMVLIMIVSFTISVAYNLRTPKTKSIKVRDERTELGSTEKELLDSLKIDHSVGLKLVGVTGGQIEPLELQKMIDGGEPELKGIKSKVDKNQRLQALQEFNEHIGTNELFAFSCGGFADDAFYYVALIKTNDRYDAFRVQETNGLNYDIYADDIIKYLKELENQVDFSITEVEHDSFTIEFKNLDFNLDEFCRKAVEFCPDFLNTNEDAEELKRYVKRNKALEYWWD